MDQIIIFGLHSHLERQIHDMAPEARPILDKSFQYLKITSRTIKWMKPNVAGNNREIIDSEYINMDMRLRFLGLVWLPR